MSDGKFYKATYVDYPNSVDRYSYTVNGTTKYCYPVMDPTYESTAASRRTGTYTVMQFYTLADSIGYLEILQNSIGALIDEINVNANENNVTHRVAIVGFASDSSDSYQNTGLYDGEKLIQYSDIALKNYQTAFKELDGSTAGGYATLLKTVDALASGGGTHPECAFEIANNILKNKPSVGDSDKRQTVIIMFTDGIPGDYTTERNVQFDFETANETIAEAYRSKSIYQATVYTVGMVPLTESELKGEYAWKNASGTTYTDTADTTYKIPAGMHYMELVSSNYPNAQGFSAQTVGTYTSSDTYYQRAGTSHDFYDGESFNVLDFADEYGLYIGYSNLLKISKDSWFNEGVRSNSIYYKNALDSSLSEVFNDILNESTHDVNIPLQNVQTALIDKLSDDFDLTDNSVVTVWATPGKYADGNYVFDTTQTTELFSSSVGALPTEPNANGIKVSIENKTITVEGYDFSDKYITTTHPGYRLEVRIDGVLLTGDISKSGTLATNTDDSGIYYKTDSTAAHYDTLEDLFPVPYVDVKSYTYVLDFGLKAVPTAINKYTVCSLSEQSTKQASYSQKLENYPYASIVEDALTFDPDTEWNAKQSFYALIQGSNGVYEWAKVTFVPASNLLFEEDEFTITEDSTKSTWSFLDDSDTTLSAPAVKGGLQSSTQSTSSRIRYGMDSAYTQEAKYSDGHALKVSVSDEKRYSEIVSFQFTGTGCDIISACGKNTGVLLVSITTKNKETGKDENVITYFVDTYYNDSSVSTMLYQVPIINNLDLDYATYTVKMLATYLPSAGAVRDSAAVSNCIADALEIMQIADVRAEDVELVWLDESSALNPDAPATRQTRAVNSDGSVDLYIDSIRIYNPLDAKRNDYYLASEQQPTYLNLINSLISDPKDLVGNQTQPDDLGIVYVEADNSGSNTVTFDPATYQDRGPQNEIYLAKDQGIMFVVNKAYVDDSNNASIQISARVVNGNPNLTVNTGYYDSATLITDFRSAGTVTELYYEIAVDKTEASHIITITNTGDGLLALVNLKLVDGALETNPTNLHNALQKMNARQPVPDYPSYPGSASSLEDPDDSVIDDDPVSPVEPNEPSNPDDPAQPDEPTDPENPAQPDDPIDPDAPTKPDEPDEVLVPGWNPFKDVKEADWFYDEVRYAYEHGIFNGITRDTFGPNMKTTRAMFVTVLGRMTGMTDDGPTNHKYTDVDTGIYYASHVAWADRCGIVQGVGNATFLPDRSITREEAVTMLYRYADYLGYDVTPRASLNGFADAGKVDPWALDAMQWAVSVGMISGKDVNGKLCLDPLGNATRAEIATMLMRFLEKEAAQ